MIPPENGRTGRFGRHFLSASGDTRYPQEVTTETGGCLSPHHTAPEVLVPAAPGGRGQPQSVCPRRRLAVPKAKGFSAASGTGSTDTLSRPYRSKPSA